MAASSTHGITVATILTQLPFASGSVTQNGDGLTTRDLSNWINESAGTINGLLRRHGIDPDSLSADTEQSVVMGIRAYVRAKALSRHHSPAEEVAREWDTWESIRVMFRDSPQNLGSDQSATKAVATNIDTANPTSTLFNFSDPTTPDIF